RTRIVEDLRSQLSVEATTKKFHWVNGTHEDKKPSMSYDSERHKVHCFSCNADYDIFDLYTIRNNLTPNSKEVFNGIYSWLGIPIDKSNSDHSFLQVKNTINSSTDKVRNKGTDYRQFFNEAQKNITNPDCMKYLNKRGISTETAKKYGIGYMSDWQSPKALRDNKNPPKTPRIIIPTSDYSYAARDVRDEIDDGQKQCSKMKEGGVNTFNLQVLEKDSPCFVTEGEFDALSFLELGYNALSLGSASNTISFLKKIKELSNPCSLIIVLDADKSGKKAREQLVIGLQGLNISFIAPEIKGTEVEDVYRSEFYGDYKDANDFLVKDKVGFENEIKKALSNLEDWISTEIQAKLEETEIEKSDYFNESVSNKISDFRSYINASKEDKTFATGFDKLDEIFEGGLHDGLYILGAISSLGKTTFAIQIADYLSSKGQDVLYISLEMSRYEIMAKSISRHTYLYCQKNYSNQMYNAKSQRQILEGKKYEHYSPLEHEIIYCAGESYKQESSRLWIYEVNKDITVDEINQKIDLHKKHTDVNPVIIIDYLQIITPTNHKLTEKQSVDQIVKRLKQISRDLKVPILGISSLNRENYKTPISMQAFKESGGIEYSADVLLGLQLKGMDNNFDVEKAKNNFPREIELKILKNRRGRTGGKIDFYYYPQYNYFTTSKTN
ncbi:DnaB-like helicase C-terminal domain-containing protein, partial [Candidatus Megaera venefica]|uniref:DnaB-like helicase C-terminal domain-containing protein n=1 Tax=Candidatus Megaera venefica TaxID=2055910 RepID=UPI002AD46880